MNYKTKVFVKTVPMARPTNALAGIPVGQWKIAGKLCLEIGKRYSGRSYVDMMNNALLTNIKEGYIKSSYPLDHVGIGDGIAWFAYCDGNLRRSGRDGVYRNEHLGRDEIIETCEIDEEDEYIKKRSRCRPVRFVFERLNEKECVFIGIFYQVSINIYRCSDRLIGETLLKRYDEYEKYL